MKIVRTMALAAATALVAVGLVGVSAPAHAQPEDTSWGWVKPPSRV